MLYTVHQSAVMGVVKAFLSGTLPDNILDVKTTQLCKSCFDLNLTHKCMYRYLAHILLSTSSICTYCTWVSKGPFRLPYKTVRYQPSDKKYAHIFSIFKQNLLNEAFSK